MNSWLKRRHERRKLPHYVLNMFVDQTKDYKIGICCFSAKHAVLRRKNKYWLIQNQDNVSECKDMSTQWLLFQWASTINIQLSALV